ncbi:hypothetical protein GPECTOR_1g272 [Gonium pectorale]|uniref:Diacylglycerol kinase n=1 Tax=Gonium pectorale TaxID=33097 RepID=A0A150H2D2_GONPE|nr:hypothetical protein GPECTOR_1g272 [Gonium pectorale]|eukprot:KXZ56309.1 hypothetical protein GPECTOR_1g272 [Gonium pectorale]
MSARGNNTGSAPAEVVAPPADEKAYEEWRRADTLRAPYKVSAALLRGTRQEVLEATLETPLLCFVNARSGGRMGAELALLMSRAIGKVQVFDIGQRDQTPDKVLYRLYENLRAAEASGDARAAHLRQRLRLLVCGGDGTIAWVMGVIKKLRLNPEPPIAIVPLGTGNDLSRTFLWGAAYERKWIRGYKAMYNTLNRIATAREDKLDCWNITITTPRRSMFNSGVPHCLSQPQTGPAVPGAMTPHARPSGTTSGNIAAASAPAYGRNQSSSLTPGGAPAGSASLHPAVAAARESLMASLAMGDRSVAASVAATHGSATALPNIATSSVGSAATTFTTATNMSLHTAAAQAGTSVPPTIVSAAVSTSAEEESGIGIRMGMFWNYFSVGLDAKAAWGFHSLREQRPGCTSSRMANQFWYSAFSCTSGWFCCAQPLNVKSYAGGRNLWGPSTSQSDRKRGLEPPSYNDGVLEAPYFRDDGEPSHCYMQIDGEPWKQDIPVKDQDAPVRVEIVHAGVSRLLRNQPQTRTHSATSGAMKPPAQLAVPLVNATSEPASLPTQGSQSQSSIQLAAPQSMPAPTPSSHSMGLADNAQATSVSGALQHQPHPSGSGAPASAQWTRVGSGGRPSLASIAGSSTGAGAGGDAPVTGDGGGAGSGTSGAVLAAGRPGDLGSSASRGVETR